MDGTKRGTIAWQPLGGLCNVRHPDQLHSEPAGHAGQPWVVVSLALVWSSKNVFNHNIPYCWTCFRMVDDFNLYFTILNPLKPFGDEWGGLCVGPPRWKYYTQVFLGSNMSKPCWKRIQLMYVLIYCDPLIIYCWCIKMIESIGFYQPVNYIDYHRLRSIRA